MTSISDPALVSYLRSTPLEKRKAISRKIITSYPGFVPVIVGRGETKVTPSIKKNKFLAPSNITLGKFLGIIRLHVETTHPHDPISFFVSSSSSIPVNSMFMQQVHEKYKSEDGFLYVSYVSENTFGSL